jgi:hypothetical protein
MTNEEAIKDIKETIKPVVGGTSLEIAIKCIENQIKYKWILCDEKLPDKGMTVLLQTAGNQMTVAFLDKKSEWYVDSGDYFCTNLCAKPIAWMPLPEAYKEEVN